MLSLKKKIAHFVFVLCKLWISHDGPEMPPEVFVCAFHRDDGGDDDGDDDDRCQTIAIPWIELYLLYLSLFVRWC